MQMTIAALAHAQIPPADTLVVVSARSGLETAAQVSVVVVGSFFILLLPVLFLLYQQIRKVNRTLRDLGERGLRKADPLLESGKAALDNVEFVTMAVRTDVERVTASVKSLSDRLQQASDRMEERISEFNALMEVVQSEAEGIFVETASAVRGVRAGARALGSGRGGGASTPEAPARGGHAEDPEPVEVRMSRPRPGA